MPNNTVGSLTACAGRSSFTAQSAFFAVAADAGARIVVTEAPFWGPFWGLRMPRGFSRLRGAFEALHSAPAARAPASGAAQYMATCCIALWLPNCTVGAARSAPARSGVRRAAPCVARSSDQTQCQKSQPL